MSAPASKVECVNCDRLATGGRDTCDVCAGELSAGAVDVLGVLRQLRQRFQNCRELAGFEAPSVLFAQGDAAIAVVAELIAFKEAAEFMLAGRPDELRAIQRHAEGLAAPEARRHV